MTAGTATAPLAAPSFGSRTYGLGSIFGKTLRDSRRAILLTAALLALIFLGVSRAIVTLPEFATPESRAQIEALVRAVPPILQGFAGPIINIDTLGGYLSYKYGTFFPLVVSMWSILALSGTLAAEARRGSLEFVAASSVSRRRVAFDKLSGHLVGLIVTFVVAFIAIAIAGQTFAQLPQDRISLESAFGYSSWMVLMALAAGAIAFALGPFIGRGAAAGIAGFITLGGWILNGYQAPVPELAPFASLTWFGWTTHHVPLAGQFDWPSVAIVAGFVVVLLVIGVEAFARRDIGSTSTLPSPSIPRALVGLRGPFTRSIGHNLAAALAWGLGIGIFGLLMAASAKGFVEALGESNVFVELLARVFPGIDFANVGGFLQLLFIELGIVLGGLAAATLVAGWASEETSGRLEMLLAAPVSRVRWALSSGAGLFVNMALVIVLVALGIAIGGATSGGDLVTPLTGALVLAFYGWALIGIGMAVGGVFGSRLAAPVVVLVVLLTWFVQLLGPLLGLPEIVQNLALTRHFGQTMVGVWDLGGVMAALVNGLAGVLVGAWGFRRRDLRG